MASPRVEEIFRFLVKGLRPEALHQTELTLHAGVRGDRAFAFQFLDEAVPQNLRALPAQTAPWMSKAYLAVQHDWPELARIVPRWQAASRTLRLEVDGTQIEENVDDSEGRQRLATFVHRYLETTQPYVKARRSTPSAMRLLGNSDLSGIYTDSANGFVSLGLTETHADLEQKFGAIDHRRFRLNFYLAGAPAWSELQWVGKELRLGECRLQIVKAIGRCPNIDVDPDSGARCEEIFPRLKKTLGHAFVGVRGTVLQAGIVRPGDTWELL